MAKPKKEKTIIGITYQEEAPRKAPKVNLESMQDAIIDGVPKFTLEDELLLRRDHLNDKKIYVCIVKKIHENGDINLRNLTLQQDFIFNLKNPPTLKLYLKKS